MRKNNLNFTILFGMLIAGLLSWSIPTKAQQLKIDNSSSLDLNFGKIDPLQFNGSSFTIDGESLRNMPVTSIENLLSGLVPGFFSKQNSGSILDESPSYWIRGRRTTSEGVLTLVDGQERDFGSLTPSEIDKITVLKDAAAIVLYGMRAANGAILVTTRRGVVGKPKVEFSAQLIQQQSLKVPKAVNGSDYARYYNEAYKNDNPASTILPYPDPTLFQNSAKPELYPDVNWYDTYYRPNQLMQRYNLNVYGGTQRTRYFVNFGALTHEGNFKTDKANTYSTDNEVTRYNIRSNFEVDVTPTTMLKVDVYGLAEFQNRPGNSSINVDSAIMATPANAFPPFFTDNGLYTDALGQKVTGANGQIIAGNSLVSNPWAMLNRRGYSLSNQVYGSFRLKLDQDLSAITQGLKASGDVSMDSRISWVTSRTKGYAYYQIADDALHTLKKTGTDSSMVNTVGSKASTRQTSVNLQLSYNRTFDKHTVNGLAFYNQYESSNEVSIATRFQGVGGWLGYNFDNRYGIDLMASYQASYKFAKGNFGLFPTLALGWTISNEKFFESLKPTVSYLKLRGSVGQIGSDRGVAAHQYLSAMTTKSNVYNFGNSMAGAGGYIQGQIANPFVTWEKSLQSNIGIEAGLFNNQLNIVAEYFNDQRTDIYMTNNLIGQLYGLPSTIKQNIGSMYSRGTDLSLQWNSKVGDFTYNIGGTFSYSMNKIQDFGETEQAYPWLYQKGYSVGITRGYVFDGFFMNQAEIDDPKRPAQTFSSVQPGDIRYKDLNEDQIIDVNDKQPIGYANCPQFFYGINLGAEYKGFGFTALFQGAANVSYNIAGPYGTAFTKNGTMYENQLNHWSPTNMENAEYPRLSLINGSNNAQTSSVWIKNGDYLRLKTAQVYYNFSEKLFKGRVFRGAQIYIVGYDLFTWDNIKFLDPEFDASGGSFPMTRNISIGCTLKF